MAAWGSMREVIAVRLPAAMLAVCVTGGLVPAGEVQTQSGFVISGRPVRVEGLTAKSARQSQGPVTIRHVWMIEDGMRRTFVPNRQVRAQDVKSDSLISFDEFDVRRERTSRVIGPSIVGSYLEKTPFDLDGRRLVTLAGAREPIRISQEITKLRPDFVTVNSTSHRWTHALSTSALDDETLLSLLRRATDPGSSLDRLRVVRFLVDAERYTLARQELAAARGDWPELEARADQLEQQLHHLIAVKALGEIQQRRRAGQHRFAYAYAQKFPADRVSADVLREAGEILNGYRTQEQKIQAAHILLGELQAELPEEQGQEVGPLRSLLCEELDFATIGRLEPFLRTEGDDTLSADQKLGLAYTGWLLGDARADTSLARALRLWRVRFLVLESLRAEREVDRRAALRELHDIDGASVESVAAMVPQLPLPVETDPVAAGVPLTVEIAAEDGASPVRYSVVLPPEYTPGRAYPLLIALRSQGTTCEQALQWWAGTADQPGAAMKHGYLVIAPEYLEATAEQYNYGVPAHQIVLRSLNDVRRRYQIDSDRVFLAGHGMGGDAAFDIGMSHPDLFAGVLPVVGLCDQHCKVDWKNCPDLAWYVVGGEKDRDSLEVNATVLNRMMIGGYDLTYVEYIERGYETYFEERPRMFAWMELHRRAPERKEFEIRILRPTDAQLYWVEATQFREDALQPVAWTGDRMQTKPQPLEARITPGGTIHVWSGAGKTTIKLSPSLISFDERIPVNLGTRRVHNEFITPDLESLLSDLRERGDRQRLYWARLEF
ncbi:MAG: hypothetical protein AB7U20_00960 [Planctomycetaceae bacterium]